MRTITWWDTRLRMMYLPGKRHVPKLHQRRILSWLDFMEHILTSSSFAIRKWQMDPALIGTHPPPQISFSKAFDTFCPIGPCITSANVWRMSSRLSESITNSLSFHSLSLTRTLSLSALGSTATFARTATRQIFIFGSRISSSSVARAPRCRLAASSSLAHLVASVVR